MVNARVRIDDEGGTRSRLTVRGARTRASLVKAARAVFEKQGYLDTNIGDISTPAGVAHGTSSNYFSSQEEIFSEVVDQLTADIQRMVAEEPQVPVPSPISARIEWANRGYLRSYEHNAKMMAMLESVATFIPRLAHVRLQTRRFWVQRSTVAIRRWQERGLVDERIEAVYTASALGSFVDRTAYVWIVLGEPYDFEMAVKQLTLLHCNALGVPYGVD